jgi:hypothetical protein
VDVRLKYVGPRPEISFSCVSFNTCKEDKFVYISSAYQLLKTLQHDYGSCNPYTDTLEPLCINEGELEKMTETVDTELTTCIKHHQDQLQCLFDKEIQWIKENQYMDAVSKKSYYNNHALMKEYRLQRQINKSVYYMLIQKLAHLIKQKRITYIITPLNERFTYVLINLQKTLMQGRTPVFAELEVFQEQDELKARLRLNDI